MTVSWYIALAFLVAAAAAVNAAGYVLGLWHDETIFDEVVHFFTSFALMAALGTALIRRGLAGAFTNRMFLTFGALGLLLGLLWEAVEWAIGIIGGRTDTLLDLAMDLAGAVAAAALVSRLTPERDAAE